MPAATFRPAVDPGHVQEAVAAYNNEPRAGLGDGRLWRKAETIASRYLRSQISYEELADFAWEVKKWGHIQGVSRRLGDDRAMATGLITTKGAASWFSNRPFSVDAATRVVDLVDTCVDSMARAGRGKRHYSWASKTLHWILPEHVPVYDSFVRQQLGIGQEGGNAYRKIVEWEYSVAASLPRSLNMLGTRRPTTMLRALDKYLWWLADQQKAEPEPKPRKRRRAV